MTSARRSAGTSPKLEIGGKALARRHGVFEAASRRELEGLPQIAAPACPTCGASAPECSDPASGDPLESVEPLRPDIRLAPGELALADEQERVGEIVERRAELLDREQQLLGRHATFAGLDGRNRLAVLEAEQAREIVLGQLALFAQGLDPRTDELGGHEDSRSKSIANQYRNCNIILQIQFCKNSAES